MAIETGLIHATCIAHGDKAVLLRGASASGKSDLALRCLFLNTPDEEYKLVSDDQVRLERKDNKLVASAPFSIFGKIEVRGIGIVEIDAIPSANVHLIVDLVPAEEVPRMPENPLPQASLLGLNLPYLKLNPFENSAPLKLQLALKEV